MKKKLVFLVILLIGLCALLVSSGAAASPKVAVNDTIVGSSVISEGGGAYVSNDAFQRLGVRYSYDSIAGTLHMSKGDKTTTYSINGNGNSGDPVAYYRNGTFYVPISYTARNLGFSYSYISGGPIYRIYDRYAALSDDELLASYHGSQNPTPSTPDQPQEDPADEEEEEEEEEEELVDDTLRTVCWMVEGAPSDATSQMLRTFSSHNAKATFFLSKQEIAQSPATVVNIAAEGHGIGISLPADLCGDTEACQNYIKETNALLQKLIKTTTRMVKPQEGATLSEDLTQQLQSQGYRIWSASVNGQSTRATALKEVITQRTWISICLNSSWGNSSTLSSTLTALKKYNCTYPAIQYTTAP